jgi:phage terminase Nu1 subunit (DNA packaging protein)
MRTQEPCALREHHERVMDVAALAAECQDQDVDERRLLLAAKARTAKLAAGVILMPSERQQLDRIIERLIALDDAENERHDAIQRIAVAVSKVFDGCRRRLRRLLLQREAAA